MNGILLDTNTVIYYLQHQFPAEAMNFVDNLLDSADPCLSVITEIELLCWKAATLQDIKLLQDFIDDSTVIELEKSIKLKAIEIRRQHKIKLPDTIIAATALTYNIPLITRNVVDFKDIAGIVLQNPWDYA
ncbi:MAG: type II toxin-antitoxin system VapC family toxin [Tannerella sp.]|jgi:predicted nucleic acid-binding protein|nr:type II toxin-antitoxin system VapC family toxin [Tannerella sp.]